MSQSRKKSNARLSPKREQPKTQRQAIQLLTNRCLSYLAIRPRSEKEMTMYIAKQQKRTGCSDDCVKKVQNTLTQMGLIDDKAFTSWFVAQRTRFRPKGMIVIRSELLKKGVERKIIDAHFNTNAFDETTLARHALERKWKFLRSQDPRQRFKKAMSYLSRRGFSYGVSKKVFEELTSLK